jgi:hypothetical protein
MSSITFLRNLTMGDPLREGMNDKQLEGMDIADKLVSESGGVYWPSVEPKDLALSIKQRIRVPQRIRQGTMPYCGPAAVAYLMASENPILYAKVIVDLYRKGAALLPRAGLDGYVIEPDYDLRMADYTLVFPFRSPENQPAADWILLSSIRNSENWWHRYWGTGLIASCTDGSLPSTMIKWLRGIGYTKFIDETNLFFTKGLENLKAASGLQGKWKVLLFINSQMLYRKTQNQSSSFPNHYVVLAGKVSITRYGGEVENPAGGGGVFNSQNANIAVWARVFTWGRLATIPEDEQHATLSGMSFCDNYYGFIAARH